MMPPPPAPGTGYERTVVSSASLDELDSDRLHAFLRQRAPRHAEAMPLDQLAGRLGFIGQAGGRAAPTVAGLVAFGDCPQLVRPEWGLAALRVRGNRIADPLVVREDLEGPLTELLGAALGFVDRHTVEIGAELAGEPSRTLAEYPAQAVREALLNALVHRDYRLTGRITLRIFDDRLEVWSPGGLPGQIQLDANSEAGGVSLPRNPLLAATARTMGLVDQVGRGIPIIRQLIAERTGQAPALRVTSSDFVVGLPSGRGPRPLPAGQGN